MRAVVQRVTSAEVRVAGERLFQMGAGLLAFVGVGRPDGREQAEELAHRLVHLRIFADAAGKLNRSLLDRGGTLGVISQFTLYGDARRGNRPSYTEAAPGKTAEPLYDRFCERLGAKKGVFGAQMSVALVNDGPVTLMLESD